MSNFRALTKLTKEGEKYLGESHYVTPSQADWIDDYFGPHKYGIRFVGEEHVFPASEDLFEEVRDHPSIPTAREVDEALHRLEFIDGPASCSDREFISALRQYINEGPVHNHRLITNQELYEWLVEIL